MADSLYIANDDLTSFESTALTEGPWRTDAQHGGPPSALLGFLTEQHVGPDEALVRINIELRAGVPLDTLQVTTTRTSMSRRVHRVRCELRHQDQVVAISNALVLTGGEHPEPGGVTIHTPPVAPGDVVHTPAPTWASASVGTPFHRDAVEHRFVSGAFGVPGAAVDWVRLKVPVVEGHALTGIQRVLACTDLGSGISALYDPGAGFGLINADLDVSFFGEHHGDWVLLDAESHLAPSGTGVGISRLFDEDSMVAIATQSLLGTRVRPAQDQG